MHGRNAESPQKLCQPGSYLMALGPPLQTRWRSQVRELTNELLGEDQEAEPHTHWSTAALGRMLRVRISTVKTYSLL